MLILSLPNDKKTCRLFRAVLVHFSMTPPDAWQYFQLADNADIVFAHTQTVYIFLCMKYIGLLIVYAA